MKRAIPVLIVGTILALLAATGADRASGHMPATATNETTTALAIQASNVKRTPRKLESPREKARRIIAATWPASQVDNAMRVVACESGFNQWAANLRDYHSDGSRGSYGLLQIGALWRHDPEVRGDVRRLYLPWTNIRVGLRIYLGANDYWANGKRVVVPGGSWRPWTCARILGIR